GKRRGRPLPRLLCASAGNHGLAVAAGAELVGAPARVYLHRHVPARRAIRITEHGSEIVWVEGTYDDAVDEAHRAARRGDGLLISGTSSDANDPVVADVMAGYGQSAQEIVGQLHATGLPPPTPLFVQAGFGGLAATIARGLAQLGCRTVVVEPDRAACVGAALRLRGIERLGGDLESVAEMLACGEASAPAVEILSEHQAQAMAIGEETLTEAPAALATLGGPSTTPSGATGFAGFASIEPGSPDARRFGLGDSSRVLLMVSEGPVPVASP